MVRALEYKVVELSSVDEHSLQRTLNEWAPAGWAFDGVQFAMRESSKRPAMAFVFFTREGPAIARQVPEAGPDEVVRFRAEEDAHRHLRRLAAPAPKAAPKPAPAPRPAPAADAWSRLAQLADSDFDGDDA